MFLKYRLLLAAINSKVDINAFSSYFLTNFISKVFYFFSFLFFTHYLTKEDLGILSVYNASVTYLSVFIYWGIDYNLNAEFFKLPESIFRNYFKTVFFIPIISVMLITLLLFISFNFCKEHFAFKANFLWMIPLSLLSLFYFDQICSIYRNEKKPRKYVIITSQKVCIEIIVSLILIKVFNSGWYGRIIGLLSAYIIPIFLGIVYLYNKKYFRGKFKMNFLKQEINSFLPVFFMNTSMFVMTGADKLIVNFFYGKAITGSYSIATNFSSIFFVFGSSLQMFFQPKLYNKLSEGADSTYILQQFKNYLILSTLFLILLSLFVLFSYYFLINRDFMNTITYCYITLFAFFLSVLTNYFKTVFIFYKENSFISKISISSIILSIFLSLFLRKKMGLLGISSAILVSNMVTLSIYYFKFRSFKTKSLAYFL